MSKARVVVLEVTSGHLSVTAAARTYGLSRQHLPTPEALPLGGLDAVDPRSRRPASNPRPSPTRSSPRWYCCVNGSPPKASTPAADAAMPPRPPGLPVPSTSTIRRILHHHGLITPSHANDQKAPTTASKPPNPTNAGNPTSPTGPWPTAPTSRSSTGSTTTPDTCWPAPHTASHRRRRGDQLHRDRTTPRPARIHPDRQRIRIHRTIHPRPQRLRTPSRQPGHHPEKRSPRPSPNPRQNRTLPPNPQTLAHAHARAQPPSPSYNLLDPSPPSTTPNALTAPYPGAPHQHRPTTPDPKPTPADNPPDTSASATTPSTNSANSPCATAAAYTTSASACTHARTPVLILVPPNTVTVISKTGLPHPLQPHHRPRPQLLAQPTKTPRPMAGAICNP